jgi:hypothetical protein
MYVLPALTTKKTSSDKTCQGTVIIPYVKGISEKIRRIGNSFNDRIIFKTKHVLHGILVRLDRLETPDRRNSVWTISNMIVGNVTAAKKADL